MPIFSKTLLTSLALSSLLITQAVFAAPLTKLGKDLTAAERQQVAKLAPGAQAPKDNELVHIPPTMNDLAASNLHPKMKEAISRGYDLFTNTQQLYGKNVFNNMNCSSCHMGDGRLPFAGPVWPAAIDLPAYRGKNDQVNSLEERVVGCFTYSMNGKPPAYGSDDMLAITLYIQYLATGVPMFTKDKIYGRGYPRLEEPKLAADAKRGEKAYQANCSICHGDDGQGVKQDNTIVYPALWGDDSYNWGAGIIRIFTLASFIHHNMPIGKPNTVSVQDSWDIAMYVNTKERPQDPRYTGDIKETLKLYSDTFHKHSMYGQEFNGKVLGNHSNAGHKDFLKPDILRARDFSGK